MSCYVFFYFIGTIFVMTIWRPTSIYPQPNSYTYLNAYTVHVTPSHTHPKVQLNPNTSFPLTPVPALNHIPYLNWLFLAIYCCFCIISLVFFFDIFLVGTVKYGFLLHYSSSRFRCSTSYNLQLTLYCSLLDFWLLSIRALTSVFGRWLLFSNTGH